MSHSIPLHSVPPTFAEHLCEGLLYGEEGPAHASQSCEGKTTDPGSLSLSPSVLSSQVRHIGSIVQNSFWHMAGLQKHTSPGKALGNPQIALFRV